MKTFVNVRSVVLLVMMFAFGLTLNAQRRYKHPRGKADAKEIIYTKATEEKVSGTEVKTVTETVVENETAAVETEKMNSDVTVASTTSEVNVKKVHKTITRKNATDVKEKNTRADLVSFLKKMNDHTNILKVQDIEKTNMETWVLIVIILGAAALLFLILAIIGIATLIGALYLIGWIFFGLCITALLIVLLLGLLGVI